jgi:hypothetical protein
MLPLQQPQLLQTTSHKLSWVPQLLVPLLLQVLNVVLQSVRMALNHSTSPNLVHLWVLQVQLEPISASPLIQLLHQPKATPLQRLLPLVAQLPVPFTASNLISSHQWKTNLNSTLVNSSECSTSMMMDGLSALDSTAPNKVLSQEPVSQPAPSSLVHNKVAHEYPHKDK